jgi:hypothetical protein
MGRTYKGSGVKDQGSGVKDQGSGKGSRIRIQVKKELLLFLACSIILLSGSDLRAQKFRFRPVDPKDSIYQVSGAKLVAPVVLMGLGFTQFMIPAVNDLNLKIRSEVTSHISEKCHLDNYSQYVPAVAVYGLDLIGVRGRHDFLDRSFIFATSMAVMGLSVNGMKQITHVLRPDGSSYDAFPSGHTATAFTCAEFLRMEYRDVSPWIGLAGYAVAAGTGFLRMYNNRHWLTDVVAGAGFGILSTRLAYWVFPGLKKALFKDVQFKFSLIPPIHAQNGPTR